MTEKRKTSQGYIIRILQHFATKLWNITNFVMLFEAVMKFLSRLVEIKMLSITQVVNSLAFGCQLSSTLMDGSAHHYFELVHILMTVQ
jgi:hypothetical protein